MIWLNYELETCCALKIFLVSQNCKVFNGVSGVNMKI